MTRRRHDPRRGLTLLEVVVSMLIFLVAATAIWQLLNFGSDRAMDVKLQAATSLKCRSKMAEVIIGAEALTDKEEQPFPDPEGHLKWSMKVSQVGIGVYEVKIWVKTEVGGRVNESFLAQYVMEPTMRGSTQDRPETTTPPAPAPTPAPAQ